MKNIIWTEKELKNIKKIILTKANLKLNDELELVQAHPEFDFRLSKISYDQSPYSENFEALEKLFYETDRTKIKEVLEKAQSVEYDPSNNLHYGMILAFSKINPENHEEIFIIFREIIAQYEKTIASFANRIAERCENVDELKNKINEITNNQEPTTEELLIQQELNKVFIFSKGVTESDLFKPLIEKLNNSIKEKLIHKLKRAISKTMEHKTKQINNDNNAFISQSNDRYLKRIPQSEKKTKKLYHG